MREAPLVSVVIVNWNRLADVRRALDYLERIHYGPIEVIVVDNGSTDGSVEEFGRRAGVRLIPLASNEGPCVARNAGVAAATGPYVFFLDSDAMLSKRALGTLVERMEREPEIALIGCRVDNWDTRRIDQWIYAEPHQRRAHQTFDTYSFSAAGAIARRAVLMAVGGFAAPLRIYNEEVDLSIRLLRAGHRIVYDSAARVLHRPATSGRAPSRDYWRLQLRNWIWIFRTYYPRPEAWRRIAVYAALYLVKGVANRQISGILAGLREGLGVMPAIDPGPKLTKAQVDALDRLNRRHRIVLGRG